MKITNKMIKEMGETLKVYKIDPEEAIAYLNLAIWTLERLGYKVKKVSPSGNI